MKASRAWAVAAGWTLLVFLLGNGDVVRGAAIPGRESDVRILPSFGLVADHARAGALLTWNPWSAGGSPDGLDPTVGALSPLTIGFGLALGGGPTAFRLHWLFVWALGGLGVFVLARRLRAPPWGAAVSAVGFLFSGPWADPVPDAGPMHALSLLPFAIWRADVAMAERRLLPAAQAGVILGLAGLASAPGVVFCEAVFVTAWCLGRWIAPEGPGRGGPKRPHGRNVFAGSLTFAAAFGAVVAAPVVGLVVEGSAYSGADVRLPGDGGPLRLEDFCSLLSPWPAASSAAHGGRVATSVFLGTVVLALAAFAVGRARRDGFRVWLLGLAALAAASATLGLPARGLVVFSLVVLSLFATRDLAESIDPARLSHGRLADAAKIALVSVLALVAVGSRDGREMSALAWGQFALAWIGIGAALVAGRFDHSRLAVCVLVLVASADALLAAHGAAATARVLPGRVAAWEALHAQHVPDLHVTADRRPAPEPMRGERSTNDNVPVREPILTNVSSFANRFHDRWSRDAVLRMQAEGRDRFWFSPSAVRVPPSPLAFEALRRRSYRLGAPPLVLHPRPAPGQRADRPARGDARAIAAASGARSISVLLTAYGPNEIAGTLRAPEDGWLLVTDRWAPGWTARVGGADTEVFRANFLFRAIAVRAGRNAFRMVYRPPGRPWLVALSWGVSAIVVALGLSVVERRRWAAWRLALGRVRHFEASPSLQRAAIVLAMAIGAAAVYWWPAFRSLTATGYGDWRYFHHMWEAGLVSLRRYGELPLWDPFHCGGVTLWENPQAQVYGPFFLLSFVIGTTLAIKLYLGFHAAVGLAGAYAFARREVALGRPAATLAAFAWAGSGFFAWHAGRGHATFVPFWLLPCVLLAWRRAAGSARWAAVCALCVGLLAVEGGVYPLAYALLLLAFDAGVRLWGARSDAALRRGILVGGALAGALGATCAAVRLVPIVQRLSRQPRLVESVDKVRVGELLDMFTARRHSLASPGHAFDWSEYGTFLGWGLLALAAIGTAYALRPGRRWIVAGAAVFGALMLGHHWDFAPWALLHRLPIFASLRVPSRFAVLSTFFIAILAGVALDEIEKRLAASPRTARRASGIAWAVALVLCLDVFAGTRWIVDAWDGPAVTARARADRFHLVAYAPDAAGMVRYFERLPSHPRLNVGTPTCFDPMEPRVSSALWTGDEPQARVTGGTLLASGRTPRTVWAEVALDRPGRVLFDQNAYPGWRANVGRLVQDRGRAAVDLPAGTHRTTLRYEPASVVPSAAASAVGVLSCLWILFRRSAGPR